MECEHIAFHAARFCLFTRHAERRLRQPCHFVVISSDIEGVGGRKEILIVLDEESGKFIVDTHQFFLLVRRKGRPLLCKLAVVLLYKTLLHRSEPHLVAAVVDLTDTAEKVVVEGDTVGGIIEQWYSLIGKSCKFGCAQGIVEMIVDGGHTLQNRTEILKRQYSVVEIRHGTVLYDCLDVAVLLLYAGLDGRNEVRHLYLRIGCDLKLRGIGLQEWILMSHRCCD